MDTGTHGQHADQGKPSAEVHGSAVRQNDLGHELSELARHLQAEDDVDAILDEVVRAAVQLVPGTDEGSISVVTGRRDITSQSPSSELPAQVDAVQGEVGQGPCLDAVYEHQTVRVPDMRHEQRWPDFARRAFELGAGSMLSFQLYVEGDNLGALNLYGRQPNAFDEESEDVGLMFASHAAIAFADARKLTQLRVGIDTRDLIGQAKGILMERYAIDAGQAFTLLTRISQRRHRKIRDLAEELTQTRRLVGLSTD
jgi:transcriptional regulator with GAF, ATPase, and Fis domain